MKNKFFVILDTNIIVSTFLSKKENSPIVLILKKIMGLTLIPIYSNEILKEYIKVLKRNKFKIKIDEINKFILFIKDNGILINPDKSNLFFKDFDDLKFYEVYKKTYYLNTYLITGNIKHFPKEKNIVSPSEFIDLINEE